MYAGKPVVRVTPHQASVLDHLQTSTDRIAVHPSHRRIHPLSSSSFRIAENHRGGGDVMEHYHDLVNEYAKQARVPHEDVHNALLDRLGDHVHPAEAMGFWGDLWGGIKRGLAHIGNKIVADPEGAINSVAGLVNAVAKTAEVA